MNKPNPNIAYIFPNLFTAASCFFGVLSVISSFNSNFDKAIIYIIISLVLDGLDGRVARLTNTTSSFGMEFDSLCDLVAFGVAPSVLFYCVMGHEYGRVGSLASGMFVVFGAIRLARFNITTMQNEPNVFIGLPIPLAAVFISSWIHICYTYDFHPNFEYLYILVMIAVSLLMVSNIRYPSFKMLKFSKKDFRKVLIFAILLLAVLYICPYETIAFLTTIYILYGFLRTIWTIYVANFRKK